MEGLIETFGQFDFKEFAQDLIEGYDEEESYEPYETTYSSIFRVYKPKIVVSLCWFYLFLEQREVCAQ